MFKNKKLLFALFVLVALAQLFVPAKMIYDREVVLSEGKDFKFETVPVDPTDPFRGKYITLSFNNNEIEISIDSNWKSGQEIYVSFIEDKNGFAKIESIHREIPTNDLPYIYTTIDYVNYIGDSRIAIIDFPFDRLYMEETKAYNAEKFYNKSLTDSINKTYALVSIKNGETVLKDVYINDVSVKEVAKVEEE